MTDQNGHAGTRGSAAGPLGAFVADLEQLRRDAGQPSLRKMAERAHYSHTALSSVLSGTRLPSLELTLAFVRACDGDENTWRQRWSQVDALVNGAAPPADRPAVREPHVSRRALAATGGIAAVVAAVILVPTSVLDRLGGAAQEPVATSAAVSPAADGADPQQEQCHLDAVSTHTVQVPDRDPAQPPYGSLTLRYSQRCQAAWPLFVSTERVPTGVTIRLSISRPSDGAVSRFDYPYLVPSQVYSVYGNVLRTTEGCVEVAVEISSADDHAELATAATPCAHPDPTGTPTALQVRDLRIPVAAPPIAAQPGGG
ncbi:uncharacterized protein DUF2690 [Micromonospora sp. Llam0]|uniref:DUF2690 domain-containing protein n=1 Tax=Micromonospora sp. Llam0 TaxID=2485143 RepID=UPI000F4A80A8|nr:DUF2690 domain-containing protein [Micromonospora sp. Llam0]ROO60744.1 uncharacterized protein DUF2690 [Micromonospora sp. Llam0]